LILLQKIPEDGRTAHPPITRINRDDHWILTKSRMEKKSGNDDGGSQVGCFRIKTAAGEGG